MSYKTSPIDRARLLRKNMTEEEKILWQKIKARRFYGFKFLRQHPIIYEIINNERKYFIPDFYCAEKKVIIEIDGKIHEFTKEKDKQRETILNDMGFKILRIKNEEFANPYEVMKKMKCFIFDSP